MSWKQLLARLGEEAPTYNLVYDVVSRLPADLVTLAHQGSKAYGNSFDLIYRREAARSNAIWQADHTPLIRIPIFAESLCRIL